MQEVPKIQTNDFRLYLQSVLTERCKNNSSYSLRAFAKSLDVDHSSLSQMIRGKRKISDKMKYKFSKKLGLGPNDLNLFMGSNKKKYNQMTLDSYHVASDWYYFAILELMVLKDFDPSPSWIAMSLGLSVSEVNIAIERLERIGFISIDENGQWTDTSGSNTTTVEDQFTTQAHIKHQGQLLDLAKKAMLDIDFNKRGQTGMTMAADSSKVEEANRMILKFRRELCTFLEDGECDSVFHLGISLFPLTKERQS